MSEPPPDAAPERAASGSPRPFSNLVTAVCSIVVVLYVGLLGRPLTGPHDSPLTELERPADSLERLVTRDLELRTAMRSGYPWEWRLYRALSGDEDPLDEATDWYAELVDFTDGPMPRLQHVIVLAESRQIEEAREVVADWPPGDSNAQIASWLDSAYLGPPPSPELGHAEIGQIEAELPESWFSDTLVARIAARIGDPVARAHAQDAILARGRALLVPARTLMALSLALLALGLGALVWLLSRRSSARVAHAPVPPMWGFRDGYALFVRALGAPQAIVLALFVIFRRATEFGTLLGMASDLPVLWWITGYLHARREPVTAAFGLAPPRRRWGTLLGVTLVLIAAALVGDVLIDLASGLLSITSHWSDGFPEELLWASPRRLAVETVAATVWAPIIEELTFRGVLYGTLRTWLGPAASAVLSATVFTLPHGYGIAGSASVLLSGILWAVAYERTRSLWPGLIAHSANNVLSTLWAVALLR